MKISTLSLTLTYHFKDFFLNFELVAVSTVFCNSDQRNLEAYTFVHFLIDVPIHTHRDKKRRHEHHHPLFFYRSHTLIHTLPFSTPRTYHIYKMRRIGARNFAVSQCPRYDFRFSVIQKLNTSKNKKMSFLAGIKKAGKKKKKKTAAQIKADEEKRRKEKLEKLKRMAKRTGRSEKSNTVSFFLIFLVFLTIITILLYIAFNMSSLTPLSLYVAFNISP